MSEPWTSVAVYTSGWRATTGDSPTTKALAASTARATTTSVPISRRNRPRSASSERRTASRATPPRANKTRATAIFTIMPRPHDVSARSPRPPPIRQVCHTPVTTAIGAAKVAVRESRTIASGRSRPATRTVTNPPIHSEIAPMCTASTRTATPASGTALGCPPTEKVTRVAAPTSATEDCHHDVDTRRSASSSSVGTARTRSTSAAIRTRRTIAPTPNRVSRTRLQTSTSTRPDQPVDSRYTPCTAR